jgi:putative ABC transport system ATP-binding protein
MSARTARREILVRGSADRANTSAWRNQPRARAGLLARTLLCAFTCPLSPDSGAAPSAVRGIQLHRKDDSQPESADYGIPVAHCGGRQRGAAGPTVPRMDALIRLSEVTKRYGSDGRPAVDRVRLDIAPGEAVAVMGPSGSGKSTLLNLIAGLDRPTSGTVTVAGRRIDTLSETGVARFRRQQVGMIFQFFNLLDDLTVADNVLLPAQLAGVRRAQARARVDELLAALRIGRHRDAYPGRLSGGERQRVAIARALVNRPALLLADEPTGALDTATGEEIGELLIDLNRTGQSLVLVTHNPDLAARYASRTVQLVDGRIASDATTGALGAWR